MENTTTMTAPNQTDLAVIDKKRAGWADVGENIYHTEIQLQMMAQKEIMSLAIPQRIEDVPAAEEKLKALKAKQSEIEELRKGITNTFREVADRLMQPEKSFEEPVKKLTSAIVDLKKKYEAVQQREANRQQEIRMIKERIVKYCAEVDAKLKMYINELIDKAYVFAINNAIPPAQINAKIKEWSDTGAVRVLEYKIEKLPIKPVYITATEAEEILHNNFNIKLVDYANTYDFTIKEKFKDYEVAYMNKAAALEKNAADKLMADKAIADQKLNTEISASIESNVVAPPTNAIETKALKKTYEVDMPETVDNALLLFSAFAANKEKCLQKLKVNKWFSFNAGQVAVALSKIKSEDNIFQPQGVVFKEIAKL